MREKTTRLRIAARLLPGILLGCGLVLGLTRLLMEHPHRVQAESPPASGNSRGDEKYRPYFWLTGPNDGEPINSRILRLRLETSYAEKGFVSVSVNDTYLYSQPLDQAGYRDGQGVLHTDLDLDLILAGRLSGTDLLCVDAGPARVAVYLHSASTGRLLTSAVWSGYVGKPWVELLPRRPKDNTGAAPLQNGGEGGISPAAAVPETEMAAVPLPPRVAIHPMRKDIFYMLIASPSRELLKLTPDEPRLLREGRLVDCGSVLSPTSAPGNAQSPQNAPRAIASLDSLAGTPWEQSYLVLWTYDSRGVWRRSVISPLATR